MDQLQSKEKLNVPAYQKASCILLNNMLEEVARPIILDVVSQCRNTIGITSFSKVGSGDWLWNTYGGRGNGAIVEFEIPDASVEKDFHSVAYVKNHFLHVDLFLSQNLRDKKCLYRDMLCTKTRGWEREQEIRFLGRNPNSEVAFYYPITSVIIGENVSESERARLIKSCKDKGVKVRFQ